ncbi:MAG TPA: ATP synthase F0 subunit B [Bryobacteraceae bacterium]|nr:ATP synthase F0 subunit B [Bryobacteraceae bacterium]
MEKTLHDLGQLLLKAIPTVFLLLVVHFYLKFVFFKPMSKVLAERRAATAGQRESAEALRAKAEEQTRSIEEQLRQAHEAIYQEQDEARRQWTSEQTAQLDEARQKARELIHQSKQQLDAEAVDAKNKLGAYADTLADQIAKTLLERSAA